MIFATAGVIYPLYELYLFLRLTITFSSHSGMIFRIIFSEIRMLLGQIIYEFSRTHISLRFQRITPKCGSVMVYIYQAISPVLADNNSCSLTNLAFTEAETVNIYLLG